ncbi:MAG: SH3 domain-containing protein [Clostridia bacterium]
MNARRTKAQVLFAGVDISFAIKDYLISLSYTDNEEDEADDLQIKLHDRGGKWIGEWLNTLIQAASRGTWTEGQTAKIYKVKSKKRLAVRSGPGKQFPAIGKLTPKASVRVFANDGEWTQTILGGRTGYVMSKFLLFVSNANADAGSAEEQMQIAKGLRIQASIVRENWTGDGSSDTFDCGDFELDSVDTSGPASLLTIKASSLPFGNGIRETKKTRAWEKYKLSRIAQEMADLADMETIYDSDYDPYYKRVEQYDITDIGFLKGLCHRAGLALKVTNNTLVLFDQEKYERQEPVATIKYGVSGGYTKYRLGTGEADTSYVACHVSYTDPESGKKIEAMAYSDDYKPEDMGPILEVNSAVASIAEAEALAKKLLRMHNKFEYVGQFTFPGNPIYTAGLVVSLSGWGLFDGKYIINRASHKLSSAGYITTIDIRRVLAAADGNVRVGEKWKTAKATVVRKGPSNRYKKIGRLKKNTDVYVMDRDNGWVRITFKGKDGYILEKNLKPAE